MTSAKLWLFYFGFHVLTLPKLNWTRDFRENMGPSQYKDFLSRYAGMGIPMIKIRRSWDRLIGNMGIPRLVRLHSYTETVPVGQFHERFFHRDSNLMGIVFCSHPSWSEVIAMKFCTWHDSCAAVACAKCCNDLIPYNGATLTPIFHHIGLTNHSWNGPRRPPL